MKHSIPMEITVDTTQLDAALAKARELAALAPQMHIDQAVHAPDVARGLVLAMLGLATTKKAGEPITRRQLFGILRGRR